MSFNVGDEVELIAEHVSCGITYTTEATIGSWGRIEGTGDEDLKMSENVSVIWDAHPEGFSGSFSSNVDADCLRLRYLPVTEDELNEVYESFGVK